MRLTAVSFRSISLVIVLLALCALLGSQTAPREQVGPLPGGGFLLNSGWRLNPAGKQIPLDTLPLTAAITPDNKYMLVLNCGYRPAFHYRDRSRHRFASKATRPSPTPGSA